jgi:hypothetical protein
MGGVVDITSEYHDARKALRKTIKRIKPDVPESMIMAAMVDELLRYCGDEEGRKSARQWMDYKLALPSNRMNRSGLAGRPYQRQFAPVHGKVAFR